MGKVAKHSHFQTLLLHVRFLITQFSSDSLSFFTCPICRFSRSPHHIRAVNALCRPLSLRFVRRLINLCPRHRTAEAPVRHVSPLIPPLGRTNGTALARYARKSADCPFELSGPITCGCVPAGTTLFQSLSWNLRELVSLFVHFAHHRRRCALL